MEKIVKFKFEVGQEIRDRFDNKGIIDICAIDQKNTIMYYVEKKENSQWEHETDIRENKEAE
jgi:hypothetical protein